MMNLKKVMKLGVILPLILSGCSNDDSVKLYTPGTYTASAKGYHGTISVEVKTSEDRIEAVTVKEHTETEGVGTIAIDKLPQMIVDEQSLGLDVISGATLTSNAILNAAADALKEAGGDIAALTKKVEKENNQSEVKEVIETDVLIIGSGAAGLTAAVSAKENGIENILVIERESMVGGNSKVAHGIWAAGSQAQKDAGILNDSGEIMFNDIMDIGMYESDEELTRIFAYGSGPTLDWLMANYGMGVSAPSPWEGASVDRNFIYEGSGAKLIEVLNKNALDSGVKIQCDTRAYELIIEDGTVIGAMAEDKNGTVYEIKAQAVLLATGGYGGNPEMLNHVGEAIYYGVSGIEGDGHIMAEKAGAKMVNMGGIAMKPVNLEVVEGVAKNANAAKLAMNKNGAILVTKDGKRIANEFASEAEFRHAMIDNNAEELYMIMDQNAYDIFKVNGIESKLFKEADLAEWQNTKIDNVPVLFIGDDLEIAAEAFNINAEELRQTINEFNTDMQDGVDKYGRVNTGTLDADSNFAILRVVGRFATTTGGVDVNTSMQVLDSNDQPIKGLFAAGEVVGNITGECNVSYLTWGSVSGKIFGEEVGNFIEK